MIQTTRLENINTGQDVAPSTASKLEPPSESVEKFNALMSNAPSANAPVAGDAVASNSGPSQSSSAVDEYTQKMKEAMGEDGFRTARDTAFPGMTGTEAEKDRVFASFHLTTVNMAIDQISQQRQELEESMKS
jgi:hypothetical protein